MDFYVRRGNSSCPFTGKEQTAMVKVITNDESVQTPFLSREVLLEALKILDAANGIAPSAPQILVEPAPAQTHVISHVAHQVPKPPVKKNPGGLTDQEIEVAKEFAAELIELIDNPPPDPKGQPRDGIMNSDIKDLYSKYSDQFRDPVKALYPIIRTHVLGFQESVMLSW